MKKSLLALAVLGAFAGAAAAQSSVTLYGRVDMSAGKPAGSKAEYLSPGSGSRLGVRGVEDLGGGLQALFQIEHRFEADTGIVGSGFSGTTSGPPGAPGSEPRFWRARSIVGLQGGFGQVVLGREYTPSFTQVHLPTDPFGHDTVVNSGVGGVNGGGNQAIISLGLSNIRNDSSVTYKIDVAGFTVGAQIAEATDSLINRPNKPWSVAVSYAAGPLTAGVGFERNGNEVGEKSQVLQVMAAWRFGAFRVLGGFARGNDEFDLDRTGWLVGATANVGAGEARLTYGRRKDDLLTGGDDTRHSLIGAGYHYSMSKRTTLYADVVHNRELDTSKTGYDVGVKHNF